MKVLLNKKETKAIASAIETCGATPHCRIFSDENDEVFVSGLPSDQIAIIEKSLWPKLANKISSVSQESRKKKQRLNLVFYRGAEIGSLSLDSHPADDTILAADPKAAGPQCKNPDIVKLLAICAHARVHGGADDLTA